MLPTSGPQQPVQSYRWPLVYGCLHWAWLSIGRAKLCSKTDFTSTRPRGRSRNVPRHHGILLHLPLSASQLWILVTDNAVFERAPAGMRRMGPLDLLWGGRCCSDFREDGGCVPLPPIHIYKSVSDYFPDYCLAETVLGRCVGPPEFRSWLRQKLEGCFHWVFLLALLWGVAVWPLGK